MAPRYGRKNSPSNRRRREGAAVSVVELVAALDEWPTARSASGWPIFRRRPSYRAGGPERIAVTGSSAPPAASTARGLGAVRHAGGGEAAVEPGVGGEGRDEDRAGDVEERVDAPDDRDERRHQGAP